MKSALIVAGSLFGLFSLVHLYRLFHFFPVTIGSIAVPEQASIVAFLVAGGLSFWMFCASRKKGP